MEHDDLNQAIRQRLQALADAPPAARTSTIETLLGPHRELIAKAHANGHTYRAIATTLKEAGLKASPETIRRYLQSVTKGSTKRTTRRSTSSTKSAGNNAKTST